MRDGNRGVVVKGKYIYFLPSTYLTETLKSGQKKKDYCTYDYVYVCTV